MIEPKASTLYRLVHAVAQRRCLLWHFIALSPMARRGDVSHRMTVGA